MGYNILFVTPEVAPFSKTGGLADVSASLPKALKRLDHRVTIVTPLYRCVSQEPLKVTGLKVKVAMREREIEGTFLKGRASGGVDVFFLKRDEFYDRTYLYSTPEGDYFDNGERFIFFTRAVLEAVKEGGFFPHVIHCHEWQTALLPVYAKTIYRDALSRIPVVLTIHNVAYQGLFPEYILPYTGLPRGLYTMEGLEFYGKVNFLKGGILFADLLTTVSRRYSLEIQTPRYGYGLDGVLRKRAGDLYGILNGVDYREWNPSRDVHIPARYNRRDLSGKEVCKRALIEELGLAVSPETPLIGVISRLTDQKGIDILIKAAGGIVDMGAALVILGEGERRYHRRLKALSGRYPGRVVVRIGFDVPLAHRIEAGCDMFLMPSRYEPCGLNQIYSLRYGTIPIVRATGGLDDTIRDYDPETGRGTGFKFRRYSTRALLEKVRFAIEIFRDRKRWSRLLKEAMGEDFSWHRSARLYEEVYRRAIEGLKSGM